MKKITMIITSAVLASILIGNSRTAEVCIGNSLNAVPEIQERPTNI